MRYCHESEIDICGVNKCKTYFKISALLFILLLLKLLYLSETINLIVYKQFLQGIDTTF